MTNRDLKDWEIKNEDSYDDLLVAIEASDGILSLLIAVCDDSNLREQIIERYETELEPHIRCYRLKLPRGEPSLKSALTQLVQNDEYLQKDGRAVLMVTGAEQLYFLKLGAERSEQEIFFGYLQWTREALREFSYPLVLWLTNQILVNLSKKAPDFWSWRKGVFRFVSKKKAAIPSTEIASLRFALDDEDLSRIDDDNPYFLPIEDLRALISQTEQQRGAKDPSLTTLYDRMGQIYKRRLEGGEAQDYKTEKALAIKYFDKAANLQKELGLEIDLASTLNNLAQLYYAQGRYQEAEALYVQALKLRQSLLGEEHPDVASSLNNLASLYRVQGRYQEAEPLFLQALKLRRHLLGEKHPDVARSLSNLANLYRYQGRYQEAELLYLQASELNKRLLGEEHPRVAADLNNLAGLYYSQSRYQEAEMLLLQALDLRQSLLGEEHPDVAASLNNLAKLYYAQGRYQEAEPLYLQALGLTQRLLGEDHPDVGASLNSRALLYDAQGRYQEAESLLVQALEICERRLGVNHPRTVTIRENLEFVRAALRSKQ